MAKAKDATEQRAESVAEGPHHGVTLVVITGHSGAGKSEAIAAFEDGGYFCVDNLPPRMIGSLGELFRHEGSGVERAAVVSDVRGGDYFDDLLQVLDDLQTDGLEPRVLFLEADEETLVDRYKETRRRHPLAPQGRIVDGIRAERELLAPLRERADMVMDTSDLTGGMLRRRITEEMLGQNESGKLALTLLTFGFKNGPPRDADLTLDVRFLPNPHYVDELRPMTGLDRKVREYVESGTQAGEFYGRLLPLLEFLVPAYVAEGKSHLTIAVGCTGGRHRSITVADRIRRDLASRDDVIVRVKHRDAPTVDGPQTSPIGAFEAHRPRIAGVLAEPVISICGLRKSYGDFEAVGGIDLDVQAGEVFAFLGPNGAGKTTTVEILEGYRRRSGGEVSVLGEDPQRADRSWRERIGIVLQSCRLDPYLTVRESLALYAGYYSSPRPVDEVVELVGLGPKADARTGGLSGGQQRRLDVGMALVGDPELLFLDEPTTGFDPSARRQAWETIAGLRDLGKTVFLTTHYMDEAQHLADRVTIISRGEIVADGTPEDLGDRESLPTTISYRLDGKEVSLETTTPVATLHELTGNAVENGEELEGLEVTRPNLEDVYLSLTEEETE